MLSFLPARITWDAEEAPVSKKPVYPRAVMRADELDGRTFLMSRSYRRSYLGSCSVVCN